MITMNRAPTYTIQEGGGLWVAGGKGKGASTWCVITGCTSILKGENRKVPL